MVRGRLMQGGKPLAGQTLDIQWGSPQGLSRGWVNLQLSVRTDQKGNFEIAGVPAGLMQLTTRQPMGEGQFMGWQNIPQKTFESGGGKLVDLGEVEQDSKVALQKK